jgi:Tol biopolymer transport system component
MCDRISFAGGRGICLQTAVGVLTKYEAVVFDHQFKPILKMKLDGAPTRTRISPDGRYGATTVFVTGQEHGYNSVSFSTKTTLIEMASGNTVTDLEQFKVVRDGQPFAAKDFNFWGVTFGRDSNVFYASLMTDRKTYLVRGDIAARSMTVLRENVECPSLSPNNQLIAYKKRVGGDLAPWRFYVMDLATMTERPIAGETRSIDDQLEWLDDQQVLYATARSSQSAVTDIWVANVSGAEPARQLLLEGESPIVVR